MYKHNTYGSVYLIPYIGVQQGSYIDYFDVWAFLLWGGSYERKTYL